MNRSVPMRVFLFFLLCWSLFTVLFGWAVKSTLAGSDTSGVAGQIAVEVASFPTLTRMVAQELGARLFGKSNGDEFRVEREKDVDRSGFVPIPALPDIDVRGLLMRASPAKMADGWRFLFGPFLVDGQVGNGALLISPGLKIVRMWRLDEIQAGDAIPEPANRKFVHGVEVLRDGSLIFAFDNGVTLQRIDGCGKRRWAIGGGFNHSVTLDSTGENVWAVYEADTIVQVSVEDGSIVKKISMDDVIKANPAIDILEIRRLHSNDHTRNTRNTPGKWMEEPLHLNDVEALPAEIADRFKGFHAGDLLISARSLNLVFILDPQTLEVKWWRGGATQRQHDPDWVADGKITILNNRMSRDFSEIVSLDPGTFERKVVFDGRKNSFYTRIRGKHQVLGDGRLVVTSTQQGRAFEVDRDGEVVFEVVNQEPGSETTNFQISELRWLPRDYFGEEMWTCPPAK